jgi:ribosome-binding protein aMBF1 (putative translation factor)
MKAIRSNKQLEHVRQQLAEVESQLSELRHKYRRSSRSFEAAAGGLQLLAREMRLAISDYQKARAGRLAATVHCLDAVSGQLQVGRRLLQLRQAAGLDQAALAERLGTKQSNISRWESETCTSYNLAQLQRIAEALGWRLDITFVRQPARP